MENSLSQHPIFQGIQYYGRLIASGVDEETANIVAFPNGLKKEILRSPCCSGRIYKEVFTGKKFCSNCLKSL